MKYPKYAVLFHLIILFLNIIHRYSSIPINTIHWQWFRPAHLHIIRSIAMPYRPCYIFPLSHSVRLSSVQHSETKTTLHTVMIKIFTVANPAVIQDPPYRISAVPSGFFCGTNSTCTKEGLDSVAAEGEEEEAPRHAENYE